MCSRPNTPLFPTVSYQPQRSTHRLNNPLLAAAALPGFAQEFGILRQDEGLREEAELLLAKAALHARQVPPQSVLSPNLERTWEVV